MEDLLVGIIKFFGNIIEGIVSHFSTKKAILISFIVLIICFIVVYYITKDN